MTEEARAKRNEYARKYYAEHKDRRKEIIAAYWERKAEKNNLDNQEM